MNIRSKITGRLLAGVVIVELAVLAACAPGSPPPTACHYTGDEAAPYEQVTITTANAAEHLGHPNDFMPVPVGGCPVAPAVITSGKISICHATSSESNPYEAITVSVNGLNGHGTHEGDLIPAPEEGCPTAPLGSAPTTACHYTGDEAAPYEEVAITTANAAEHLGHPNDFMPVPVGGCPVELAVITSGKISICHATSSETNPYEAITVSVNGLNGHGPHEGDLIPVPEEGCPNTLLTATEGKITICHATGSESNPYSLITISVDGLSGHNGHAGDIIPAPATGCPSG